jgi:hypothetical protein
MPDPPREDWGYKRIEGQLSNVGCRVCKSSVAKILKANGIEPAPTRRRTTSWNKFLKSHWDVFQESVVGAITLWFGETIRCVIEPVADENAAGREAVTESSDVESRFVTLTVPSWQTPESVTQSSRGPPSPGRSPISHGTPRRAA